MANGQATISFDGVNLDHCIQQGLTLTGCAKCPYCKQIYTYQINLHMQQKPQKYMDKVIDGNKVTCAVEDSYDISIDFSRNNGNITVVDSLIEPEIPEEDLPCVPCTGCTPNCPRLKNR